MTKGKKYLYYLPHIVIGIIMLMAASGKLLGNPMSVDLFAQLDLLGAGGGASRIILGIVQVVLVGALFNKTTERMAAILITLNMIGALILVGVNAQAIIVLVLSLVVLSMNKKCCMDCKDGVCGPCGMEKTCGDCKKGNCEGDMCSSEKKEVETNEHSHDDHSHEGHSH